MVPYKRIKNTYIGIQPLITKEKFYQDGEFVINILPIVYGISFSNTFELRISPILNYHINDNPELKLIGTEILLPFYFKKYNPFYISPTFAYSYNIIEYSNETTIAGEIAYIWIFHKSWELKISIQEGATFFIGNPKTDKIVNHFGIKISFGWWFFNNIRL